VEGWWLIEVNPRPGATLDIFEPAEASLFALHVDACRGRLPENPPSFAGAAAAQTVYARRAIASMPPLAWPAWTADRQPPGTRVDAGAPLCTVLARAEAAGDAKQLVQERAGRIRAAAGAEQ
jgi:predicted ATP-grasp superfamily ATP-dependent carboligase